jgi:hypothetical protein
VGIGSRELDFVGQRRISDVTSVVVTGENNEKVRDVNGCSGFRSEQDDTRLDQIRNFRKEEVAEALKKGKHVVM